MRPGEEAQFEADALEREQLLARSRRKRGGDSGEVTVDSD
jgi:hypothetical protein